LPGHTHHTATAATAATTAPQIIWTRVTPRRAFTAESSTASVNQTYAVSYASRPKYTVHWSVSLWKDLSDTVMEGDFDTDSDRDWTVKVRVESAYFRACGKQSKAG
jgi:phosphodiesterase/alkaline phosphatase D-like protein